jgi:hypothetical protein
MPKKFEECEEVIRDEINPRCGDYETIKSNGYLCMPWKERAWIRD